MTRRLIAFLLLGFGVGLGWGCQEPDEGWEIEMVGCIDPADPDNVWATCSELCEYAEASCLENGCGGVTARQGHCVTEYSTPLELGCDDTLVGDAPFKCCCDFR
jgi:hypothetical protein